MREALAAADHDFILTQPRASRKPGRSKQASSKGSVARSKRLKRRVVTIVASVICAGAVMGIIVNALMLQKSRHPAPLFHPHPQAPTQASRPASAIEKPIPSALPNPVPKPNVLLSSGPGPQQAAPSQRIEDFLSPENTPPHAASAKAPTRANEGSEERPHDLIAQLLKTNAPSIGASHEHKAGEPAASEIKPKPNKAVTATQRALVKLGFVLKADGMMGASTRQAIEQYERDHKLAIHGEVTPKLLKQLVKETGVSVE